jgi:hypothetical protein
LLKLLDAVRLAWFLGLLDYAFAGFVRAVLIFCGINLGLLALAALVRLAVWLLAGS